MKKPVLRLFLFDSCIYRLWRIIRWFKNRAELESNRRLMRRLGACGQGVGLHGRIVIHSPKNVAIGDNVHIGDNAWIQGNGGLKIGDSCHISRNFTLYTANHRYRGTRLPYDEGLDLKPVTIGRNVWIGMNVCVAPGTIIGDGAIIGMGAVVSGEVPPMYIIGNPKWRILGHRNKEEYDKLDVKQEGDGVITNMGAVVSGKVHHIYVVDNQQ
jgi:acetyltransferase-like isoleucine patch superfamily enzyme